MAQPIARIGDSVTCSCSVHGQRTGVFDQCTNIAFADGLGVILVGDGGALTCGHRFVAIDGSALTDVNGTRVVRVGDPVQIVSGATGTGVVTSGSPTASTL